MSARLGWVTTRAARGRDEDEPVALAGLRAAGTSVDVLDWDDDEVDWATYDRVVLRSAWDYPERLAEFTAWLARVDRVTELVNPRAMVEWNLDKGYLAELADAGVPVTDTAFVPPGTDPDFPAEDFVVKPAVGAGSRDAASYAADQVALAAGHVQRLHAAGATVLVQPLVRSVAVDGEWPLVFFGGRYSHAASKRVRLPRAGKVDDLFAAEDNRPYDATDDQIEVAEAAVQLVSRRLATPTYARVDLVRDDLGGHRVLEIELIEPSLFLTYAGPDATDRFVQALVGRR